ncbi:MAG: MOSC domain-containing protein [Acidiphilium sp.]|nr:MOSC domain-containing protein [Acidiphilium sp.]
MIWLKGAKGRQTMRIDTIYRYPVKGLTPEPLTRADLRPGRALDWDRAFALAQGDCRFDDARPAWRPKTEFLCLARNVEAAQLTSRFDETTGMLTLTAPGGAEIGASPLTPDGRAAIAGFIAAALPTAMRGNPRFVHIDGHSFCDHDGQVISLIGLPSLQSLSQAAGAPRQPLRFRANLYLAGLAPWEEFGWIGKTLEIGGAKLRVTERINRCAATCVNPETKRRDANPVKELMDHFGHVDCGIFAEVIAGGIIEPGASIQLAR